MKTIFKVLSFVLFLAACSGEVTDPTDPTDPIENSNLLSFVSPTPTTPVTEGASFEVRVTAENPAEITEISLYIDDVLLRTESSEPWEWSTATADNFFRTLLPGQHVLKAVATTNGGETHSKTQTLSIAPVDLRITGLSLVDVTARSSVANYDPIYMGEEVPIDLDNLNITEFSFLAGHEGNVGSVVFYINGTQFRIDNGAPYALTNNTGPAPLPVNLTPGQYTITAIPYPQINGGGQAGPGKTIRIVIQKSDLEWSEQSIRLSSRLNTGQGTSFAWTITNNGNVEASINVVNKPSWLNVANTGNVPAGGERTLQLSTEACVQERQESGTLTLSTSNDDVINIAVSWFCGDRPAFDFALERFYFNQVVPQNDSLAGSDGSKVDLIANRKGLARAFVTRNSADDSSIPTVELHYRSTNGQTGVYPLQISGSIPDDVDESSLNNSFNAILPESFFQAGTEYFVVVDPDNQIAENTDSNNRYPESGYIPLNIETPQPMEIVFVPLFIPGAREFTLTPEIVEDLMSTSTMFLPISEYRYTVREPASYNGNSWTEALQLIDTIRRSEDRNKFHHGIVNGGIDNSATAGIGQLGGFTALSIPSPDTIAHEFGHNLGMSHTSCGGPLGAEPNYPYANARTGNWGFDILNGRLLPPDRADFMSYCFPTWIGSFSFQKMVSYFAKGEQPRNFQFYSPMPAEMSTISGTITGGNAIIESVLVEAGDMYIEPEQLSSYHVRIYDQQGLEIHSAMFTPTPLDHSNTVLFEIPVERSLLADEAARIELYHEDTLLLSAPWGSSAVFSKSINLEQSLSRIAENKIQIKWNNTSGYTLWVRDADTNKILGMDSTGELTVLTTAKTLALTYVKQSEKIRQVISVPES